MAFRIKNTDTIKATATNESGKLIASLYDSGFTTIKQVEQTLISKVPYFSGRVLNIGIWNQDKDQYKNYPTKVNQ